MIAGVVLYGRKRRVVEPEGDQWIRVCRPKRVTALLQKWKSKCADIVLRQVRR